MTVQPPYRGWVADIPLWQESCQVFWQGGYDFAQPLPLVAQEDPTLLFTNSTIACFRSHLENPTPAALKIFTLQGCVRTQCLKSYEGGDFSQTKKFVSFFDMIGTLQVGPTDVHLLTQVRSLLCGVWGLEPHRISVIADPRDRDITDVCRRVFPESPIVDAPEADREDWTRWGYGRPEVLGRGITFAYGTPGQWEGNALLGNIIEIHRGGSSRADFVEAAFGVHALAVAKSNQPIANIGMASPVLHRIASQKDQKWGLLDGLLVSALLLGEGLKPGPKGAAHVLRKYIKCCIDLATSCDFPHENLSELIRDIGLSAAKNGAPKSTLAADEIAKRFEEERVQESRRYEKAVKEFVKFNQKNESFSEDELIEIARKSFGIVPHLVPAILASARGKNTLC